MDEGQGRLFVLIADNGNMKENRQGDDLVAPTGQEEGMELLVLIADTGNIKEHHQGDDLVAQGPGRGHGAACTHRG